MPKARPENPPPITAPPPRARAIMACLVTATLAACSSEPPVAPPPPALPMPVSPAVRGGDNGLELQWLVIDDPGAVLGPSLAPYADRPAPIDPRIRERWRRSGLRLIPVPLTDLDAWRARLRDASSAGDRARLIAQGAPEDKLDKVQPREPFIGPENHQWLGQVPAWTDAVRGPAIDDNRRFTIDGGPGYFGPGRFRLLVRCWTVPQEAADSALRAALHIELVPQFQPQRSREDRFRQSIGVAPQPAPEDDGPLLSDLFLTMTVTEGDAYLIVPESIEAEWAPPAEKPTGSAPTLGPAAPTTLTLGHALLTKSEAASLDLSDRRPKAIVVLIPRVPARYELFGP
jgi:hypothetical protein